MKAEECGYDQVIEAFDATNYQILDASHDLDNLKQLIKTQEQGKNIAAQCYFKHSNPKLFYAILFWAFTPKNKYQQKSIKSILSRVGLSQIQLAKLEKFNLEWDGDKSLANLFWQRQNMFYTNKILLLNFCSKLDIEGCQKLIRVGLEGLSVRIQTISGNKKTQLINKKHKENWIAILKMPKYDILAIHSSKNQIKHSFIKESQQAEATTSHIQPSPATKEEKVHEEETIQAKQQSRQQKKKNKNKERNTGTDASSEISSGNKNNPTENENQRPPLQNTGASAVSWFQVAIILIILLALLSQWFQLLDPLLHGYNSTIGNYYGLQIGSAVDKLIFRK